MDGAVLPHRPAIEEHEEDVRTFTREQLDAFLRVVHREHATMFRVLAATGMRWSELAALRWRDLELDGKPRVKVRRALSRRRTRTLRRPSSHRSRSTAAGTYRSSPSSRESCASAAG